MWVSGRRVHCCLVLSFLDVVTVISTVFGARDLHRPFNHSLRTILIFGDSTVDPGNNNYVGTPFRSDFPPYGRDFAGHVPTGRFTNGRLVTDFIGKKRSNSVPLLFIPKLINFSSYIYIYIAAYSGIKENVPPYLKPMLSLEELKSGVSFASAGSGLDPITAQILVKLSFSPFYLEIITYIMNLHIIN